MKYVVILGDGMADYPVPELDNKTPLQVAKKPNIDCLASSGEIGLVSTIPKNLPPGSDVANMSVLGYDPERFYTGRSPIEAVSMGIDLAPDDITFRCNLVTLSDEKDYSDKTMIDYSSDEISSAESKLLISTINDHFKNENISFYPGVSYRHCMVWKKGPANLTLTPPHDISGKKVTNYLPGGSKSEILKEMMVKSYDFLNKHPLNKKRKEKDLNPANSIWLWGHGTKPSFPSFSEKYGINGSVISAVDLVKGLGICAGLNSVDVKGATGNINTNFIGKALSAIYELESGKDFVYIHIEAPDECGHRHEVENKVKAIELIDKLVVKTVLEGLEKFDDYKIMILPDHPTPLVLRTHVSDPVPFILYQKTQSSGSGVLRYDEYTAKNTGLFLEHGHELMDYLFKK